MLPEPRRVKKFSLSVQFMKTRLNRYQAPLFCAMALGMDSSFSLAASGSAGIPAGAPKDSADIAKTSVPWPACRGGAGRSQLGAKAGANYQGDGLAVSPTAAGARLRCVFQRLEGEATREGLWLSSTVTNAVQDRLRVAAAAVGREVLSV